MRLSPPIALVVALLTSCAAPEDLPPDLTYEQKAPVLATALDHTPGYFRDTYRVTEAQQALDPVTAVEHMELELWLRLTTDNQLPAIPERKHTMLEALWSMGLRSVQAASTDPTRARQVGELIWSVSLGLDPALQTFNQQGGQAIITAADAATLARSARTALDYLAQDNPTTCGDTAAITARSTFNPGPPETVWVAEYCEPDRWYDGFCQPDIWVEEDCYQEWIPDYCEGGEWVDEGYWDYRCYDEYTCEYEWVEVWIYYNGHCAGGYWDEYCYAGYWEPGLCYDGYWVEGECTGGYAINIYPQGSWSFAPAAAPPPDCTTVRRRQFGVARAGIETLAAYFYNDLPPVWQTAAVDILNRTEAVAVDEGVYHAMVQVLEAVENGRHSPY